MDQDVRTDAFREGRRAGLAIAALAGSAVSFISLLGIEKAVLAFVLAVFAIRGAASRSRTRWLACVAIVLAMLYVVTFVVVMIVFRDKLGELIRLLQQMS